MGAKDVQEAPIQASLAQPNVEKAVAYSAAFMRNLCPDPGRAVQDGLKPSSATSRRPLPACSTRLPSLPRPGSDVAVAAVKGHRRCMPTLLSTT